MFTHPDGIIHYPLYIIHESDVGTWRATFLPFVIQTTEGRKDPGSISQPEVDVTEILHYTMFRSG